MTAKPALRGRSSSWRRPCGACDKIRATCPRCAVYLAAANGHAPRRTDQAAYRSQRAAPYGMDLFEYEEMIRVQDGRCVICSHEPNVADDLDIDHNHTTGKVRGLLCAHCNVGLGRFMDDPELLEAAAAYLRERGYSTMEGT